MKEVVCVQCESVETAKTHVKGHFIIELFLWMLFLLPGLVYSIWRLTTKSKVCKSCLSPDIVPVESPRAKRILQNQ